MVGPKRFEHVQLRVEELAPAVGFYTDAMGLAEVERRDGVVYLGCGLDGNYDLAVREGGTGLDHFAVRVADGDLRRYERRLRDAGVAVERHDGTEPGQERGIRFSLPVGASMELVTVADRGYHHADEHRLDGRDAIAPLDVDHVTLGTTRLRENVEFLRDVLGFSVSEVLEADDGEWRGAFVRRGDRYHDVGFVARGDDAGYHTRHVAWTVANVDHLKRFVDHVADAGRELEVNLHRHYGGDALAAYFWEPGGNRFEVCTEEAVVDAAAPTTFVEGGYTAWGGAYPPDSYDTGT